MSLIRLIPSLIIAFTVLLVVEAQAKELYVCDEGDSVLLTDQKELGCPTYEPQGDLTTVPDGATWADVKWAVAVKLAERPSPAMQRAERVRTDPCAQWLDLELPPDSGLDQTTAENTRKWTAWSRIVPVTDLCKEYLHKDLYSGF